MPAKPLGPSNQVILAVTRAQTNALLWYTSTRYRAKLPAPSSRTQTTLVTLGFLSRYGDRWNKRYKVSVAGAQLLQIIRSLHVHSTDTKL